MERMQSEQNDYNILWGVSLVIHQAVLFPDINVSNNKWKLLAFHSILEKTSIIPKEGKVVMC